jgi:hypothetical protein
MHAVDGLTDNNNNKAALIIKELIIDARIHEHDFISIKSKNKHQQLFVVYAAWFIVRNVVN